MTPAKITVIKIALSALVAFACLFANERASLTSPGSLLSTAQAVIGRPLTPISYAGVARRTTRRAVAAGVYGAPVVVVPAPVVVAPVRTCTQIVNAYGQIITQCY